MRASLEILRPGPCTTLQDLGRIGRRAQGVPVAGAMDRIGLRIANALVGNPPNEGVLELCLAGPTIRIAAESVRLAVAGAARLERIAADGGRRRLTGNRSWRLSRGDVIEIGPLDGIALAYLAVEGGFDLAPVLGSLSTHLGARLGPLNGRPLIAGQHLPLRQTAALDRPDLGLGGIAPPYGEGAIRVVPGPQAEAFTEAALATLLSAPYRIGRQSDRMGMRLEGPPLTHRAGADIESDGVVAGCLQVPGDGQPILLLADHQTTGGYAKIATAISADLPRLGRALPGTEIRFRPVTVEWAEAERRRQERRLVACLADLRPVREDGLDLEALYGTELISAPITDEDPG